MHSGYRPLVNQRDTQATKQHSEALSPEPAEVESPSLVKGPEGDVSPPLPAVKNRRRLSRLVKLVSIQVSLLLTLMSFALMGGNWYYNQVVTTQRVVNERPCHFEGNGLELTGTRSYSYLSNEAHGYQWHSNTGVAEKTVLNVPYSGLTVVAIHLDRPAEVVVRGKGEGGIAILPNAEYYAFFSDNKAGAVHYSALCK